MFGAKFNRLLLGSLALVLVVSLSGCFGGNSDASSEEMAETLKTAFANWQNADSGSFSFNLKGEIESDAYTNDFGEDVEAQDMNFDAILAGKTVSSGDDKYDFELSLDGTGSLNEGDEQSFSAKISQVADTLYFRLDSFPNLDTPEAQSINTVVALFQGKWWSLPVPEDIYDDASVNALKIPEGEELTEEERQLKELYENTDFFESINIAGSTKVEGVKSTKYDVVFDKEAIFDYLVRASEINGDPIPAAEQEDLRAALENAQFDLSFWVADSGQYLTKMAGTLGVESLDEERSGDADLELELVFSDYNKDLEVVAPEGSTPFEFGDAFGAGFAAGLEEGGL